MPTPPENLNELKSLERIVADLRGPQGCPWDKEQTTQSLTPYLIEECFELVEALELGDPKNICEELGDLLFQVALHSQLAAEKSEFDLNQVVENINTKMLRRHPHVFANVKVRSSAEVIQNWETIKKLEKVANENSPLQVPRGLPALQRAHKIGKRTEKLFFDWENHEQVLEKVEEELAELKIELKAMKSQSGMAPGNSEPKATIRKKVAEELGDLFFALAQLARHLDFEPEQVLRESNRKFENRFEKLWQKAKAKNRDLKDMTTEEKESLWSQVKKEQKETKK